SFDYSEDSFVSRIRSLNHISLRSPCLLYDDNCLIFDSKDLLSDLDNENSNQLWYQKGFSQLYFRWKNKQKNFTNSYHCFITKISLPWEKIVEKIILSNNCKKSLLMI
ncbi:hypothetical protein BLA29_011785, partial [Euroglyphus maynei]